MTPTENCAECDAWIPVLVHPSYLESGAAERVAARFLADHTVTVTAGDGGPGSDLVTFACPGSRSRVS